MITEKSCGAVVFTRQQGRILYAIICSVAGICGFPKGHMEKNETEKQTALREVLEETGLKITLLEGFREECRYPITVSGEVRNKQVVLFLGEYENQRPTPQKSEVCDIRLLDYTQAMSVLRFEDSRRILTNANRYLLSLQQGECR